MRSLGFFRCRRGLLNCSGNLHFGFVDLDFREWRGLFTGQQEFCAKLCYFSCSRAHAFRLAKRGIGFSV